MSTSAEGAPARAMTPEHGMVVRYQLDSLIASLAPHDNAAGVVGDEGVLKMVARLIEARDAAREIETRDQSPARRGVRLVKPLRETTRRERQGH